MAKRIRVLIVEDTASDAELMARALAAHGFSLQSQRVATQADYLAALDPVPDVILADYRLPGFSGPQALHLLAERDLDVPFIVVSGTISDVQAANLIKAGASDFLLKDRMARLGHAVEQALARKSARDERRRLESALRESEEKHRLICETTTDAVLLVDARNRIRYANPAVRAVFGHAPEELVGADIAMLQPERFRSQHAEAVVRFVETGVTTRGWGSVERVALHRNGHEFPVEITYSHMTMDGEPVFVGFIRDITEREKVQKALLEREAGLRQAQLMAKLAHVVTGPDGEFESWSETLPQLIGVEPALMPRSTRECLDLLHPDDRAIYRAKSIEAGIKGTRTVVEYRLRREDGTWVQIRHALEPLPGEPGALGRWRWFNTLQDVTEQKRVLESFRESEERYRAMFENAAVGIVHTDLEGHFLLVNPKFCEMTGYAPDEIASLGIGAVTDAADMEKSVDARARLVAGTGAPYERELRLIRKDGPKFWAYVTTSLVRAASHQPEYFISVLHDVSVRKRMEFELKESEAKFRDLIEQASDGIFLCDAEGHYVLANSRLCEMLGYREEELLGLHFSVTYREDETTLAAERLAQVAKTGSGLFERSMRRKDGGLFPVEVSVKMLHNGTFQGIARDISERKKAENKIRRLNRVYAVLSRINALIVRVRERDELFREVCRIAFEQGGFAVAWAGVIDRKTMEVTPVAWQGVDEAYVKSIRRSVADGDPAGEGVVGTAMRNKQAVVSNDIERDPRLALRSMAFERGSRALAVLPLMVAGEAAGVLVLHAREAGFFDEREMKLLLELAGDISFALEHIEKSERLDYLAYYDPVTGLANRTLYLERLGLEVQVAARDRRSLAIVMVDVDGFNKINDAFGRQAGDDLLRQIAERILRFRGEPGWYARVGSNRFAIMDPEASGEGEVGRRAEEGLKHVFGPAFRLGNSDLKISGKVGIAMFPSDGADAETLYKNAEAALKNAKASGERYLFYTHRMSERVAEKLALENKLRSALEREEFVLHFQPKVDLDTRRITGVEALIRWQSHELGLVPPAKFIPLMEETGLILEVGNWAMQRAVFHHRDWLRHGPDAPRIAVNVSPIQLRRRDFVTVVEEAIRQGAGPPGLDVEITESILMADVEGNIEKLKAVRDLGVNIAIDDFGTGYSSLGYLARLPVQAVKIDRSFIVKMVDDPDTMTLVSTIISLAHSLRLKVVAEGVESEEQAKFLRLLRCDEMQGYLFSKPLPLDELTAFLGRQK
ncbi:MAG: PAS domain S-box protein [Burkholderiales bacterium]|nr:PAS domain S-box protein [Burkholderiales bacterium]